MGSRNKLTTTQFFMPSSANVIPLFPTSKAFFVRICPTVATNTATKDVSISFAIRAVSNEAVDGGKAP